MRFNTVEERFMAKVEKIDSCWIWTGFAVSDDGYGRFHMRDRSIKALAHRASYLLFKGEIPNGLLVCHSCNNKRCVNPDHLYLGTNQKNIQDAFRDGLFANRKTARGVGAGSAKLTEEQVREIRSRYGDVIQVGKKIKGSNGITIQQLAKEYELGYSAMNGIIRRKSYADV